MALGKRSLFIGAIVLLAVVVMLFSMWGTVDEKQEEAPPAEAAAPAAPVPETTPAAGNGAPIEAPHWEEGTATVSPPLQEFFPESAPANGNGAPSGTPRPPAEPALKNGGSPMSPPVGAMPPAAANGAGEHAEEAVGTAPGGLDKYKVELGVDAELQKPGPPGELKVWIGDPSLSAGFSPEMATAETTVPAIGQSAKVTPFAPDFEITPAESICMKIHPSGSEIRFALKPRATGTFKVGADVLLFEAADCQGTPVPKSAATLKVEVVVNKQGVAVGYLLQLWDILWQGVLDFWKWLVAAVFALLIFLIRKRLKKWFGFDAPGAGK